MCEQEKREHAWGGKKESKSEQMMHIYIFKGQEVEILQDE